MLTVVTVPGSDGEPPPVSGVVPPPVSGVVPPPVSGVVTPSAGINFTTQSLYIPSPSNF